MIHGYTEPTADYLAWVDARYPERDVIVEHTSACDQQSHGDECIGGCPIVQDS